MTRNPSPQQADVTPVRMKKVDDYTFVKQLAANELKEARMNLAYTEKQYRHAIEKMETVQKNYDELCANNLETQS